MSLTPSTMLALGTTAPAFTLPDASGGNHTLDPSAPAPATLVVFMCNHCPYVVQLKQHFADLCRRYMGRGVKVYAINANDAGKYPDDSPRRMLDDARQFNYPFPYLVDTDQAVAKAYAAACTPDFFLFDSEHRLAYRGQYDDARPGNGKPVTGRDLQKALDLILAGQEVPEDGQRPSMGCNIKWKPGNAPDYFG